jgi:hypothetical protein
MWSSSPELGNEPSHFSNAEKFLKKISHLDSAVCWQPKLNLLYKFNFATNLSHVVSILHEAQIEVEVLKKYIAKLH